MCVVKAEACFGGDMLSESEGQGSEVRGQWWRGEVPPWSFCGWVFRDMVTCRTLVLETDRWWPAAYVTWLP